MKIVALIGSPRLNGNSAYLAGRLLETARNLGAETKSFALNTLKYRGCQACRACKKSSDVCVIKDDAAQLLEEVREADVVVFASPVYFADVSGQLKLFIDRTYSFLTPDFHSSPERSRLAPGKIAVFIQTQGLADTMFADVPSRYEWVLKFIGFSEVRVIRGCGLAKQDDVLKREDLLRQAEELAATLFAQRN